MVVVLVGQPNVGKSAVWTRLTGKDALVSNYPGTSLESVQAKTRIGGRWVEVIDTPGIYSLEQTQGQENITKDIVLDDKVNLIIDVVDATNLARSLALTLELLAIGKPVLVLLNQIDRARAAGISIDDRKLSSLLGCSVIPYSALTGEGVLTLLNYFKADSERGFPGWLPRMPTERNYLLPVTCNNCSACLAGDPGKPCSEPGLWTRFEEAKKLAQEVSFKHPEKTMRWLLRFQGLLDRPFPGTLMLIFLGYLGFKLLVLFATWGEEVIADLFSPVQVWIAHGISYLIPEGFLSQVLSKGIPEGLIVPLGLVMPAMLIVSLLMALLEDTGLLPRYAVALERVGRLFGVSGQAIIPLSLGFGCRTPAVVATRILSSPAQRFIVITLLSIVIPCAATVGMVSSVLVTFRANAAVVVGTMVAVFVILGLILKKLYGEKGDMIYEMPPLRIPKTHNILAKVRLRFSGFFTEVLPLLLIMSIGVRILIDLGLLTSWQSLEPYINKLFGIPGEAMVAVLVSVVQRYLGPLVLLNLALTSREATIAISMIALSVPCMPMVVMTWREAGLKAVASIMAMGLGVSMAVGLVLNLVLPS